MMGDDSMVPASPFSLSPTSTGQVPMLEHDEAASAYASGGSIRERNSPLSDSRIVWVEAKVRIRTSSDRYSSASDSEVWFRTVTLILNTCPFRGWTAISIVPCRL